MDALVKTLELAGRYAWAVWALTALILVVPYDLRNPYRGQLWLLLLFTTALLVGTHARAGGATLWRYLLCPLAKLVLPVKDARTNLKQSRMRYYRVEFRYPNGRRLEALQEVNSNGSLVRYLDRHGRRFIPEPVRECSVLDSGAFHFPPWARIDWRDIFNGKKTSGCWGIVET